MSCPDVGQVVARNTTVAANRSWISAVGWNLGPTTRSLTIASMTPAMARPGYRSRVRSGQFR